MEEIGEKQIEFYQSTRETIINALDGYNTSDQPDAFEGLTRKLRDISEAAREVKLVSPEIHISVTTADIAEGMQISPRLVGDAQLRGVIPDENYLGDRLQAASCFMKILIDTGQDV